MYIRQILVQAVSESTLTTLANATTQIPGVSNGTTHFTFLSNLGIPLTGSMAMGFAVGLMRG